jgi:hypothetical protein
MRHLVVFLVALAPAATACAYGFWDERLTTAIVRTSYASPLEGTPDDPLTYGYCLYDASYQAPARDALHAIINPDACTPVGRPASWGTASLAWTQDGSWTAPRYWVVANNNEPAFHGCNQGPPDLSLPRSVPGAGIFGFAILKDAPAEDFLRAHLVLNTTYPNPCAGHDPIPFLQFGAHDTRGNGGVLGLLNAGDGASPRLRFTARMYDYKRTHLDCAGDVCASYFRLVLLAQWQDADGRDIPRMIQLNLYYDNAGDGLTGRGWNWPIREDMFFPGADIAYMDAVKVRAACPSRFAVALPTFSAIGQQIDYDLDVEGLYRCASDLGLFREPLPATPNVIFRAAHWALESSGRDGYLWMAMHDMCVLCANDQRTSAHAGQSKAAPGTAGGPGAVAAIAAALAERCARNAECAASRAHSGMIADDPAPRPSIPSLLVRRRGLP